MNPLKNGTARHLGSAILFAVSFAGCSRDELENKSPQIAQYTLTTTIDEMCKAYEEGRQRCFLGENIEERRAAVEKARQAFMSMTHYERLLRLGPEYLEVSGSDHEFFVQCAGELGKLDGMSAEYSTPENRKERDELMNQLIEEVQKLI